MESDYDPCMKDSSLASPHLNLSVATLSVAALLLAASPLHAQTDAPQKPPNTQNAKTATQPVLLDDLYKQLAREPNDAKAKAISTKIWRRWSKSGSASIDALMSFAANAMNAKKNGQALDILDQVIVLQPTFAEGWNRRATLYFAMKQYGKSIADIEQTLSIEPKHFGALAGLGMILQQIGQDEKALETWYKVLELFPANKNAQEAVIKLEEKLTDRRT